MMGLRRRTTALLAMTLLCLLADQGCDSGKPAIDTSLTEATVSGVVSVKGKPASGGVVLFNPSNSGRLVASKAAPIGKDGTYEVKTYTGGNQVSFDGDVATKNRGVGLIKEYVEVKPGENKASFDLLGEGGKKLLYPTPKKGATTGRSPR
ncbi:MAG TPA: hypothetical protein VGZ22_00300 [Isosphaeraceae bacterium]|jgi:hypothetical protein|nr:hypothetical protein [Isosphaeraceae bacterium]